MRCINCNQEVDELSFICPNCGNAIDDTSVSTCKAKQTTSKINNSQQYNYHQEYQQSNQDYNQQYSQIRNQQSAQENYQQNGQINNQQSNQYNDYDLGLGSEFDELDMNTSNSSSKERKKGTSSERNLAVLFCAVTGGLIALALVVFMGIYFFKAFHKDAESIDLNKYITVDFSGEDMHGEAIVKFDYDRLEQIASKDVEYYIDGELSKSSGLRNGDVVVFQWKCNDEEAEKLGYALVYSDIDIEVSGLKEQETVEDTDKDSGPASELEIVEEKDPEGHLSDQWRLYWNLENPSLKTISNRYLFDEQIQYYEDHMVVSNNYACWYGGPLSWDYEVKYLGVYYFNRNILRRATFVYFLRSESDAQRFANEVGGIAIETAVLQEGDARTQVGVTSKQAVVDFHCNERYAILADGYIGSDIVLP